MTGSAVSCCHSSLDNIDPVSSCQEEVRHGAQRSIAHRWANCMSKLLFICYWPLNYFGLKPEVSFVQQGSHIKPAKSELLEHFRNCQLFCLLSQTSTYDFKESQQFYETSTLQLVHWCAVALVLNITKGSKPREPGGGGGGHGAVGSKRISLPEREIYCVLRSNRDFTAM